MSQEKIDFSQEITAATTINLPQQKGNASWHLTGVQVMGGATPGAFEITVNQVGDTAIFPSPTNGDLIWDVELEIPGTSLPAAQQTFFGGVARVILYFSRSAGKGPHIENYFGVIQANTFAGAGNTTKTFTFPRAVVPRLGSTLGSAAGRIQHPAFGSYQLYDEADTVATPAQDKMFLDLTSYYADAPANSVVLTLIADAAGTIQGIVYY